jgi:hypothetical protein
MQFSFELFAVEILNDPKEVSGGELLKGLTLNMKEIWG